MGRLCKSILYFAITALIYLLIFGSLSALGETDPVTRLEEEIADLTAEESEHLKRVFTIIDEIDRLKIQKQNTEAEIALIETELVSIEERIIEEERSYLKQMEGLEKVLKSYQKMGATSFLEIILQSKSPRDFIRRLNILKDFTQNTNKILSTIDESKQKLLAEKKVQDEKLGELSAKREDLDNTLAALIKAKEDIDSSLYAIGEKRQRYESQLEDMQVAWFELKPLFAETIRGISMILEKGELPADAVKLSFSFSGIRASISEEAFNKIIEDQPKLPDVVFAFHQDEAVMSIPEKRLILKGDFKILGRSAIKFDVYDGSFYGFPLSKEVILSLFEGNELKIDFSPVIGGGRLRSIEIKKEEIELIVTP